MVYVLVLFVCIYLFLFVLLLLLLCSPLSFVCSFCSFLLLPFLSPSFLYLPSLSYYGTTSMVSNGTRLKDLQKCYPGTYLIDAADPYKKEYFAKVIGWSMITHSLLFSILFSILCSLWFFLSRSLALLSSLSASPNTEEE